MILSMLFSKLRSWIKYRDSVRELSSLTDRELADIGVARGNIQKVARDLCFH